MPLQDTRVLPEVAQKRARVPPTGVSLTLIYESVDVMWKLRLVQLLVQVCGSLKLLACGFPCLQFDFLWHFKGCDCWQVFDCLVSVPLSANREQQQLIFSLEIESAKINPWAACTTAKEFHRAPLISILMSVCIYLETSLFVWND